jgi:hypothetical protein
LTLSLLDVESLNRLRSRRDGNHDDREATKLTKHSRNRDPSWSS